MLKVFLFVFLSVLSSTREYKEETSIASRDAFGGILDSFHFVLADSMEEEHDRR